jgi:hypothetical protein
MPLPEILTLKSVAHDCTYLLCAGTTMYYTGDMYRKGII